MITSITSLKCWRGYSGSMNTVFRNSTDIPSGNVCYKNKDKGGAIIVHSFATPTMIAMLRVGSEFLEDCSTDFCNAPSNPPPV